MLLLHFPGLHNGECRIGRVAPSQLESLSHFLGTVLPIVHRTLVPISICTIITVIIIDPSSPKTEEEIEKKSTKIAEWQRQEQHQYQ